MANKAKMMKNVEDITLNAVTADGAGKDVDVSLKDKYVAIVTAADITTGATITFETTVDGTNYASVAFRGTNGTLATSIVIGANGTTMYNIEAGALTNLRASVGSRTDGTFTVTIIGA